MKFDVIVSYKPDILDPEGKTICHSIHTLGYEEVKEVHSGKFFQLEVDSDDPQKAEEMVREISKKLLANPNIERFKIKKAEK